MSGMISGSTISMLGVRLMRTVWIDGRRSLPIPVFKPFERYEALEGREPGVVRAALRFVGTTDA